MLKNPLQDYCHCQIFQLYSWMHLFPILYSTVCLSQQAAPVSLSSLVICSGYLHVMKLCYLLSIFYTLESIQQMRSMFILKITFPSHSLHSVSPHYFAMHLVLIQVSKHHCIAWEDLGINSSTFPMPAKTSLESIINKSNGNDFFASKTTSQLK